MHLYMISLGSSFRIPIPRLILSERYRSLYLFSLLSVLIPYVYLYILSLAHIFDLHQKLLQPEAVRRVKEDQVQSVLANLLLLIDQIAIPQRYDIYGAILHLLQIISLCQVQVGSVPVQGLLRACLGTIATDSACRDADKTAAKALRLLSSIMGLDNSLLPLLLDKGQVHALVDPIPRQFSFSVADAMTLGFAHSPQLLSVPNAPSTVGVTCSLQPLAEVYLAKMSFLSLIARDMHAAETLVQYGLINALAELPLWRDRPIPDDVAVRCFRKILKMNSILAPMLSYRARQPFCFLPLSVLCQLYLLHQLIHPPSTPLLSLLLLLLLLFSRPRPGSFLASVSSAQSHCQL